jgi:hypothetical protein
VEVDQSNFLLRIAIFSMVLTLIFIPGGFRAFYHTGMGWEVWSISRFLMLAFTAAHLLCCWVPLAFRYFRPGECQDIAAFFMASASLFFQGIIVYALFGYHSVWFPAAV